MGCWGVYSRNKFLTTKELGFENSVEFMRKLNQRKIRWIIREREKGDLSVYRISKQQGISTRWVRELYRRYRDTPIGMIRISKCGRKPTPLTEMEERVIMETKTKYPDLGAVSLEKILKYGGMHMSHNKIHRYLKSKGLTNTEPKKGKRRKWVRYERRHSNSLWHTDWHDSAAGHLIAYLDDASRFVVAYGTFRNETTENSLDIFYQGLNMCGIPRQLLTDHGSQFCKNKDGNYQFRNEVQARGTQLILARVKHPQTNGKQEKFHHTFDRLLRHFDNVDEAIAYYNFRRPHTSLEKDGRPVTPYEAFIQKGGKIDERFLNENAQKNLSRGS